MLNKVVLMGRLVADPELRQTPTGVSVLPFRIAVNRTYNRDQTDWIDIVAWRQQAEFVGKYFSKGDMIIVEGSLQSRSYEDKQGNKRTAIEVVADQVHFASNKGDKPQAGAQATSQGHGFSIGDFDEVDVDGDLPW